MQLKYSSVLKGSLTIWLQVPGQRVDIYSLSTRVHVYTLTTTGRLQAGRSRPPTTPILHPFPMAFLLSIC